MPRPVLTALAAALVAPCALSLVVAGPARGDDTVGGHQLAGRGVVVGVGGTPLPDVAATSWVVADAETGEVLAAKAAHLPHRPASTLKTLTAVTLMPRLDPGADHEVTAKEMAPVYGSRAGIVAGATYTVDDLWHALLLPSGNDAAAALAGAYGGRKKTVAAMNAEAARLQATDTHAVNPSGLDADGQLTSAYDMALLARAAIALPEFVRVSGTVSYDLPGAKAKPGKKRATFKIYGQNRMLNDGYKGVIAGKTGYTSLAGRTFWVAARRGGHTVIVTLMGIQEATETAASRLMTWGLRNAGTVGAVGALVDPVPDASPAPDGTAPATNDESGTGVTGDLSASGPDVTAAVGGGGSSTLLLLLAALVVACIAAAVVVARRRGRDTVAPTGSVLPDRSTGPSATTGVPASPSPAAPAAPASPVADDPASVPPAPVAPTGNVRVVRPPSRPD